MKLTLRQKAGRAAHLFKALCRQHHKPLAALLAPYVPGDAVVFDVGGHAGQFAKLFSALAPGGAVFTFEPAGYARAILQVVAGLRMIPNLYVMPFGLGARAGTEIINVPVKKKGNVGFGLSFIGESGGVSSRYRDFHRERVFISTVDEMVETLNLQRLDFIKADIEGFEFFLLQGAEKTLEKFRPVLLLELTDHSLARHGQTAADVRAYLAARGYEARLCDEAAATLRPVPPEGYVGGDFLFTPREARAVAA